MHTPAGKVLWRQLSFRRGAAQNDADGRAEEQKHDAGALDNREETAMKKKMGRQRRYGVELLACSAALLALGGDCTAVLVLAPLGLWLLLSKQCVLW